MSVTAPEHDATELAERLRRQKERFGELRGRL
jgi:hypothetical protein